MNCAVEVAHQRNSVVPVGQLPNDVLLAVMSAYLNMLPSMLSSRTITLQAQYVKRLDAVHGYQVNRLTKLFQYQTRGRKILLKAADATPGIESVGLTHRHYAIALVLHLGSGSSSCRPGIYTLPGRIAASSHPAMAHRNTDNTRGQIPRGVA